jgi:mycothiol synthase
VSSPSESILIAGPPEGYRARPAVRGDLAAVAALLSAYDVADFGRPDFDPTHLEERWGSDRVDLATQTLVIEAPGPTLAAYGEVTEEEPNQVMEALGRVHPAHWGRGLGSFLVRALEDLARSRLRAAAVGHAEGGLRTRQVVTSTDGPAHRLVESAGYRPVRHFWHMQIALASRPPASEPSPHVRLRGFEPDADAPAVHRVVEESFREHWGFVPLAFEAWRRSFLAQPGFDPGLWFVAEADGRVVGVLLGRDFGGRGWVDIVGVLPAYRGRGIGLALLGRGFEAFAERGFPDVTLNVDAQNETGATRLYERAGMRVRRQWDLYDKPMR